MTLNAPPPHLTSVRVIPHTHDVEVCTSCPRCSVHRSVIVPAESYYSWLRGAYIQDAMPDLSEDDREIFLTGYCPSCWDQDFLTED